MRVLRAFMHASRDHLSVDETAALLSVDETAALPNSCPGEPWHIPHSPLGRR